jgi:dihydrofolate reductase
MLNVIFCVDNSGLFGRNNGLPWHFREDLKYFKDITTGTDENLNTNDIEKNQNVIVMGYNTWVSLKNKLPNRINVVISSNFSRKNTVQNNNNLKKSEPDYVFNTFDDFLYKCKKNNIFYNKKIFIIGGKKLLSFVINKYYKYINNLFVTVVNHSFPQFLNDTIFKLSSFTCLELVKQTTNVLYCNNYNDNKLYSLNFIFYKNTTFNSFEVYNYVNNINNTNKSFNSDYNYSLLNEMTDVNIDSNVNKFQKFKICKECGEFIETDISNIDQTKKTELCNKCIYSKCRCIFC